MDIIQALIEQRLVLIIIILCLFLIGISLLVDGIKIRKKLRLSGWLCIGVGSLFAAAMLYLAFYAFS